MRMAYALTCALAVGMAVWLSVCPQKTDVTRRIKALDVLGGSRVGCQDVPVSADACCALLSAAISQGASIPNALVAVGVAVGGTAGSGLHYAGESLLRGVSWHDAWLTARPADGLRDDETADTKVDASARSLIAMVEEALEPAWHNGVPPVARLEAMMDQRDADERTSIEESAGRLAVRLLMPTGLCVLPAFILIGVIPSIISFVA